MFKSLTPNPAHAVIPEEASKRMPRQNLARVVAFILAVLLALFLFQIAAHLHPNGRDEAACNRCQLAHLGLVFARSNFFLPTPLLAIGRALPLVLTFHPELFLHYSSCRAPPST